MISIIILTPWFSFLHILNTFDDDNYNMDSRICMILFYKHNSCTYENKSMESGKRLLTKKYCSIYWNAKSLFK